METVKRVGLDTNIFLGVLLEEKDKLEQSLTILSLIREGTLEGIVSCISLVDKIQCMKPEDYLKLLKDKGIIK